MFFRRSRYGPDEFRHMGYVPPEAFEEAEAAGRSSRVVRLLKAVGVLVLIVAASGGAWFALGRPLPPPGSQARIWLERVLPGSGIHELAGPERGPPTSAVVPGDAGTEAPADTAAGSLADAETGRRGDTVPRSLPGGGQDERDPDDDAAAARQSRSEAAVTAESPDSLLDRAERGAEVSEPGPGEARNLRERAQRRPKPLDPDGAIPRAVRDSIELRLAHAEVLRDLGRYGDAALVVQGTSRWVEQLARIYGVLPFLERMRARCEETLRAIRETCRAEGERNCP